MRISLFLWARKGVAALTRFAVWNSLVSRVSAGFGEILVSMLCVFLSCRLISYFCAKLFLMYVLLCLFVHPVIRRSQYFPLPSTTRIPNSCLPSAILYHSGLQSLNLLCLHPLPLAFNKLYLHCRVLSISCTLFALTRAISFCTVWMCLSVCFPVLSPPHCVTSVWPRAPSTGCLQVDTVWSLLSFIITSSINSHVTSFLLLAFSLI